MSLCLRSVLRSFSHFFFQLFWYFFFVFFRFVFFRNLIFSNLIFFNLIFFMNFFRIFFSQIFFSQIFFPRISKCRLVFVRLKKDLIFHLEIICNTWNIIICHIIYTSHTWLQWLNLFEMKSHVAGVSFRF